MKRILYIDGYNLFLNQYNVNKAADENREPLGGFVGFLARMGNFASLFMPDKIVVVFDGPDAGLRRRMIHKGYKVKHGGKKRYAKIRINDELIEQEDNWVKQLGMLYHFLKETNVTLLSIPNYEADDIIAYLVDMNPDMEHIICSTDKDYLQKIRKNTSVYSFQKKIHYTYENFHEHFPVNYENFLFFRALVGDSSDSLGGVKGIGGDRVVTLLPKLSSTSYEDFEEFWSYVESIETGKSKTLKMLKENRRQAELMYDLMRLSSENVKFDAIKHIKAQLEESDEKKKSKIHTLIYATKIDLMRFFPKFDQWYRPFFKLQEKTVLRA